MRTISDIEETMRRLNELLYVCVNALCVYGYWAQTKALHVIKYLSIAFERVTYYILM
jgi:hypothetical protein